MLIFEYNYSVIIANHANNVNYVEYELMLSGYFLIAINHTPCDKIIPILKWKFYQIEWSQSKHLSTTFSHATHHECDFTRFPDFFCNSIRMSFHYDFWFHREFPCLFAESIPQENFDCLSKRGSFNLSNLEPNSLCAGKMLFADQYLAAREIGFTWKRF